LLKTEIYHTANKFRQMKKDIDIDMQQVISDFLELGHVENIVAMFKQDRSLYNLTGDLLRDERYTVRLGIAVLFEELTDIHPMEISLAIPSLLPLLQEQNPILRGEAATILGIIGSRDALKQLEKLKGDPDPQVREIIADIIHHGTECESLIGKNESS
jgi:HEAT repeat protein